MISDLLGISGRRILTALSEGESDPVKLADLGDDRLQCSREELADALQGAPTSTHLAVLKLFLERLKLSPKPVADASWPFTSARTDT